MLDASLIPPLNQVLDASLIPPFNQVLDAPALPPLIALPRFNQVSDVHLHTTLTKCWIPFTHPSNQVLDTSLQAPLTKWQMPRYGSL